MAKVALIFFLTLGVCFAENAGFAGKAGFSGQSGLANGAAASSFVWYSTVFDSTDEADRGSDLTGIADSQRGLLSFWVKMSAASSDTTSYYLIFSLVDVIREDDGSISIEGYNSTGTKVLWLATSANAVIKATGWAHVIISWDLGTAGRDHIYINGSDNTVENTFTAGQTLDLTRGDVNIGLGSSFTSAWSFSEVYFTTPASYFDLTTAANVQKFRTVGGKPEDLGATGATPTGTQPFLYLHSQVPNWVNNVGSGGNFTVTSGALTDGGSDKP